jgi:hypothetical protein
MKKKQNSQQAEKGRTDTEMDFTVSIQNNSPGDIKR